MREAVPIVMTLLLAASCARPDSGEPALDPHVARQEVVAAMARYQNAARTVDPDSIAAFYTPDGTLFEPGIHPIETREAIRAFIASFPGVTVDSASALPETVEVFGDTVLYWGTYFERLSFPGQPTSEQEGRFVAEWVRLADGAWLIRRMFRVPVQTSFPGPDPRPTR